jgi:CheY-like chemotaxis protein
LAIVKELATLLGGSVKVDTSRRPGSRFTVSLKARVATCIAGPEAGGADAQLMDAPSLDRDTPRPIGSRGCALLVEDNEINADLTSLFLRSAGFSVVVARNGYVCLEHFRTGAFDVVLMDCLMPVMDGFRASREIRAIEADRGATSRPVPIIGVTANTLVGDRAKCLAAGMSDFLGKPYTRNQLYAMLERWVPCTSAPAPPRHGGLPVGS